MSIDIKNPINQSFNLKFQDLYELKGIKNIDQKFCEFLSKNNQENYQSFINLRKNTQQISSKEQSQILIETAKILEDFLIELFDIKKENDELRKKHQELDEVHIARRNFVQRIISKKYKIAPQNANFKEILIDLNIKYEKIGELELKLAKKINNLLKKGKNLNEKEEKQFELLSLYSCLALFDPKIKSIHKSGSLFILPQKIDHQNLIKKPEKDEIKRNGFDLTDKGFGLNRSLAEAKYCIFCHKQGKDSCRTGLKEKDLEEFKKDSLNVTLHGCPLDQKISEMNLLKSQSFSIASLAIAVIDNPLIAGTGHRICNDCMKSCIFQKQDPVDIPQVETRTLKDVLSLPYGFEIYSLLTRWNPLNIENPLPLEPTGKKILIAGLGPAGYTLSHYLLNSGHEVIAIDGLKIEPLDTKISGIDIYGNRCDFRPIKNINDIYEPLSERLIHGFGGVAEYGITVRFNKNFLKIIRLLLERRRNFQMFGGIRFGSSITDKIAFKKYGFDHVALCIGAGRPNIIDLKNNFSKGIMSASDFLMSLQLNGAFKEKLFTNLQIRMPICVIGGGLTAIDTACEASAYYITQIKKFAKKIKILGQEKIWSLLNEEEKSITKEFLSHTKELNKTNPTQLLKKLGGVKIIYRKNIQQSPAYRLNHQEINNALKEGVEIIENLSPIEATIDQFNHIKALKCSNNQSFSCKTLIIAAGTKPNISPVLEDKLDFQLAKLGSSQYFKPHNQEKLSNNPKARNISLITKIDGKSSKSISFLGDLHPNFEGNVVKAMASAKKAYKQINLLLKDKYTPEKKFLKTSNIIIDQKLPNFQLSKKIINPDNFRKKINQDFNATIHKITRLSKNVIEIFIKAPLAASQTEIGQIFRLQNFHALAPKINDQIMAMEGVTVTALSINKKQGIISGIIVETGGSTSLIKYLKKKDPIIFMGPSGKPTDIPKNETIILIGGGRGNATLTAIAEIYKKNNCNVIFFAGYRKNSHIIKQKRMEKSCHQMIFAIEEEKPNLQTKHQYHGNVIEAIKDHLTKNPIKIDRIFTIGNDNMMEQVQNIRQKEIIKGFAKAKFAITSLNIPMQCMLKGVCSKCLQKRKNEQGQAEYFYSCANQDQNSDNLDFKHLKNRCDQNSLSEKIIKEWIKHLQNLQNCQIKVDQRHL